MKVKEPTAIEMIDEVAATLDEYGDREQADFLRGACHSMYGWVGLEGGESDAYVAGYRAAEAFRVP